MWATVSYSLHTFFYYADPLNYVSPFSSRVQEKLISTLQYINSIIFLVVRNIRDHCPFFLGSYTFFVSAIECRKNVYFLCSKLIPMRSRTEQGVGFLFRYVRVRVRKKSAPFPFTASVCMWRWKKACGSRDRLHKKGSLKNGQGTIGTSGSQSGPRQPTWERMLLLGGDSAPFFWPHL